MIGGILALCTLILAFVDKPEIFRLPITLRNGSIIAIIIAAAGFSMWKDWNESEASDNNVRTIARMDTESIFQTRLIEEQREQIFNFRIESAREHTAHKDSLKQYHFRTTEILAKHNLEFDTIKNGVRALGSIGERGHMGLIPDKYVGFRFSSNADTVSFSGHIKNDGSGTAYSMNLTSGLLFRIDNNVYPEQPSFVLNKDEQDVGTGVMPGVALDMTVESEFQRRIDQYILIIIAKYRATPGQKIPTITKMAVEYNVNEKTFYPSQMKADYWLARARKK